MNKLVKLSIKSFRNNKVFVNYILLKSMLLLFITIGITIFYYYDSRIEAIINKESNREIYIYDKLNINDIHNIELENIYYDVMLTDINISNKTYNIISNENVENDYILFINKSNEKNLEEYSEYIKIENNIDDKTIYINKKVAENIYNNFFIKDGNMALIIRIANYKQLPNLEEYLKNNQIRYNLNNDNNTNISIYKDTKHIVLIILFIIYALNCIVLFLLYMSIIKENKKNIYIYMIIGLTRAKLKKLYFYIFNFFTTIISMLIAIILIIASILLMYKTNISIVKYIDEIILIPYITNIFINYIIVNILIKIKSAY